MPVPGLKKTSKSLKNKKEKIGDALGKIRGLESQMADVIRQMQEKVSQLETLNEVSQLLNSSLDVAIVREKALEATCKLLRCETASLLLVDSKTAELFWETALGETGKELTKGVRLPIDDRSIAGYVAMTGESLILNDVQADVRHNKKASSLAGKFVTRTMVCVPLTAKDKVIGVLQALNMIPAVPKRPSRHDWPYFY
jgi:sigma-B regulation protein RsbU (phosphoserine phosphatase)